MPTLPGISGGTSAIYVGEYPFNRSTSFDTTVIKYTNGSEQRWCNRQAAGVFTLVYSNIPATDVATLNNFVATVQASTQTWTFLFNVAAPYNMTIPYCEFMDDTFTWTETSEGMFEGQIRFQQFGGGGLLPGTSGPFPGVLNQLVAFPYTRTNEYSVDRYDMPAGVRSAYPYYGAGLTNFPDRPLKRWKIRYPALTDIQLAALEQHFIGASGRWGTFAYADTDPVTAQRVNYNTCRYDMDSFAATHLEKNVSTVTIDIAEFYSGNAVWNSGGQTLPPTNIVSATLYLVSSHIPVSNGTNYGGSTSFSQVGFLSLPDWFSDKSAWTMRTDSTVLTGGLLASFLNGSLYLFCLIFNDGFSIPVLSPPEQFLIYDCYIIATLSDGTGQKWVPSAYTIGFDFTRGAVQSPTNAFDANPGSCATISYLGPGSTGFSGGGLTLTTFVQVS